MVANRARRLVPPTTAIPILGFRQVLIAESTSLILSQTLFFASGSGVALCGNAGPKRSAISFHSCSCWPSMGYDHTELTYPSYDGTWPVRPTYSTRNSVTRKSKIALAIALPVLLAGGVAGGLRWSRRNLVTVQTGVATRVDLSAIVTASGEIKPKNY